MSEWKVTISQEAIDKGLVTIEQDEAPTFNPEAAAEQATGSFDNPLPFDKNRTPVNMIGMISGAQHPGFDSIYGINYKGFAEGWFLQRKNSGELYFTNASWTEYMACPQLPPPNPKQINYPIADLPS